MLVSVADQILDAIAPLWPWRNWLEVVSKRGASGSEGRRHRPRAVVEWTVRLCGRKDGPACRVPRLSVLRARGADNPLLCDNFENSNHQFGSPDAVADAIGNTNDHHSRTVPGRDGLQRAVRMK
jgi:hypothetical protein